MTISIETLKNRVIIASKRLSDIKWCNYSDEELMFLKRLFWASFKSVLSDRGRKPELKEKDVALFDYIFKWCIMSKEFSGDLQKGIYIASGQGFGKDVILTTIVIFFREFEKSIKEYTYTDFCTDWFVKSSVAFRCPMKINDIKETGRMKRERTSIPFLEFLDYREQINLRRGLLVSSNLTPPELQNLMEFDQPIKRLEERIKECFNIILIKDAESKRISNQIII